MAVHKPYLTEDEIADICDPLTQSAAQVRFLRSLHLLVGTKPNGRPLVARTEWERARVSVSRAESPTSGIGQPDRDALLSLFQKGKKLHGAQTQK
jgi:hypothetical protein